MNMRSINDFKNEWPMEGDELPYRKSLYSTACRFTGNPQAAEDLVQETYMKAFRYYGNFKKGTNFRAWLFKILKNSFINYYRKKNFDSDPWKWILNPRFRIPFFRTPPSPRRN